MSKRARESDAKDRKGKQKQVMYVAPPPGVFKSAAFQAAVKANMQKANRRGFLYKDVASAVYALNTTGSVTLIPATLAQGVSQQQRIGKKIMWKNIQVRGYVNANPTTTVTHGAWFLVYDKRPKQSAVPSLTDILVSANSLDFTNPDNHDRFSILCRRQYVFAGNSAAPTTGKEIYDVNEFIKVNRECVFMSAGTGAIGDIEKGALYLVTVGQSAAGTTDADANLAIRVTYKDIEG